jgi:cellulose synthase operon protein C
VFYNRPSLMPAIPLRRRHLLRPLVAILLYVCAWQAFPPAYAGQPTTQAAPETSFLRAARQAIARGKPAEAEALARARPPNDPDAAVILAMIALRNGKHKDAQALLEPAAAQPDAGEAALQLAFLHQELGRAEAATKLLETVFRQSGTGSDAESVFRAARAAQALGRAQEANALYRAAAGASDDPVVDVAWGFLFHEKYNPKEALTSFQDAVKMDPLWAPAHLGMGRVLADENPPAAAAAARKALEIDPQLADAHLLLAELELDNARNDEARKHIEAVLAFNPSHLYARSLLAAIAYVRGETAAYDAEVKRVLGINPAHGDVYRVAGDLAARNYRFEEAVALARRAVELDPTNSRAFADLGMHMMRTGDEAEARRALDRSFSGDPFNRVTWNLLALLDTLDKFVVEKQDDLVVKFHPDEAPVLREYALPLAREALTALSARYNFKPKGPILIEIFPNHDDFAVRTLGLPGMIGALGACFGRVVTMDSPKAKEPGTFAWQATLWHELAHVITLQMSNQRVPRWLTEGISVFEEGRARPEWGRDMEVPFARAMTRGEILALKDLNAGFTRPETIALAYYQASLLVDHIVATHGGEQALQKLLQTYGTGVEGDAAIVKALGVSMDQLQGTFDQMLQSRFGTLQAALKDPAREVMGGGEPNIEALTAAAAAQPGNFGVQLALGQALAASGDRAAFESLERAAALVPMATGENSPHAVMARLAEQLGDIPRAIKEYQALLAHDHAAVDPARRLAGLADKAGDEKAAAVAYERIVAVDPFDSQAHTGAGRIALKRADAVVAAREFRVALIIGAPDKAAAHCDLGESYLLAGKAAEAKKEALAALEIAPTFERAQDLLLRAVEKDVGKTDRDQPAKEIR